MSRTIKIPRNPLRIGHRGAAGHAPENTLAAIEQAIKLGMDLVEFDVRRSADGALVLFMMRRSIGRQTGREVSSHCPSVFFADWMLEGVNGFLCLQKPSHV
jgi:hypothetical protein